MVEYIFIQILIVLSSFADSHKTISQGHGKNVWEFGNDISQSLIIDSKEGAIDAFSKGVDYNIIPPRCHRVIYVRVEVDNPASTPDVSLNFENVSIKYVLDQLSKSTYKILVKGIKTCNILRIGKCNGVGNSCSYYNGTTDTWTFKESKKKPLANDDDDSSKSPSSESKGDESQSSEKSQGPGKHVWQFGKNHPESIILTKDIGIIQDKVYRLTFKIKQPRCVKIVYVKVIVLNEESKPKVKSNLKTVKIMYKKGQKTLSQYEILTKGHIKCKGGYLFG